MREKAASPTVFWPVLRGAGCNWNSQGVPASLGIRQGSSESPQEKIHGKRGRERERGSALSADQSLSNDLME